jgi:hypothetical protein
MSKLDKKQSFLFDFEEAKRCSRCKKVLPLDCFCLDNTRNGLQRTCKTCNLLAQKAFYEKHKKRVSERRKLERQADPEKFSERKKKYHLENPEQRKRGWKKWYREHGRSWHLMKAFGISEDEYDAILSRQGGVCAICGSDDPKHSHGRFVVDHCHKTGSVRGLLCHSCNVGIGCLEDNPETLRKAIAYLLKHGASDATE